MDKGKDIVFLVVLIVLLFVINYQFLDFLNEKETAVVERVIDGDTIVVDGESVRLLGINAPEQGEKFYLEPKEFLEDLVLNKSVGIENFGQDKYYRELAYVFVDGKNVNIELVEKGFANVYLLDERKYEKELKRAWENCVIKNLNLCEKSFDKCADCIVLNEFDYKNEEIVFENKCDFDCDVSGWEIKEEGRGKMILDEKIEKKSYLNIKTENMWEKTGDTLFLRDGKGKLVLYYSY